MKTFLMIWALSFIWIMSIDNCFSGVSKPYITLDNITFDYWFEKINDNLVHINETLLLINDNMQRKP
jgi:hypothetical protein